jgi:hypothetical protein
MADFVAKVGFEVVLIASADFERRHAHCFHSLAAERRR